MATSREKTRSVEQGCQAELGGRRSTQVAGWAGRLNNARGWGAAERAFPSRAAPCCHCPLVTSPSHVSLTRPCLAPPLPLPQLQVDGRDDPGCDSHPGAHALPHVVSDASRLNHLLRLCSALRQTAPRIVRAAAVPSGRQHQTCWVASTHEWCGHVPPHNADTRPSPSPAHTTGAACSRAPTPKSRRRNTTPGTTPLRSGSRACTAPSSTGEQGFLPT